MNRTCPTFKDETVPPIENAGENHPHGRSGGTDSLYIHQRVGQSGEPENTLPVGSEPARVSHRRPVRFELTEQTRQAVDGYIRAAGKKPGESLFTSSRRPGQCMTTRQYARLLSEWITSIGLDPHLFGTHSEPSTSRR